ncbi:sulfur carrier protein ThiS [Rhodoferax antarcticus]|uniref:Thiamine biosynthesis protein ThiS n=1 Tax=Rhodoferax antarcticus ANT.BR TaxID=1111071 RepID=A0A1Q8YC62_9BURK|nr:sulfur carrier protein ThiS [Rhodoferax antarcticus]APW46677.1 thiamine biosynthesis protein ThiS [Rhodoferax antarcticus]MCW2312975.1 sulfur carrier protein [Rhodoferax antarcticus]OLP05575.1 thiamine biosynthesis protein ThiS [Rhodoferax antarcticus ANT.BR]
MKVLINRTPCELPEGATLAQAVAASLVAPPFVAALNLQFVPKTQYDQTPLAEGDQIELIAPVVGG